MKKPWVLFCVFIIHDSCIDRLGITVPNASLQLVVDGAITDAPGPYTVKLSRTRRLADFAAPPTVLAKSVTIFDNEGNSEILTETTTDVFQTSPTGMRGAIGKEYFVRIEMHDGKVYESIPEKIRPPGTVDSIYYEFQTKVSEKGIANYYFRIFMNSHGEPEGENYFLWKLTGTYRVLTSPDLHIIFESSPGGLVIIPDPRPCSGAVFIKKTGEILYPNPCECCQCWADLVGEKPNVSDNYIVDNGKFNKVDMGIIPVEFWPFWDKTLVKAEQLSLSKSAFDYWRTVQDQKEGATSLFQPAIGKAISNIFSKDGNEEVQGFFYASAISKKTLFLTSKDIPKGAAVIPPPPGLPPRYTPRAGEDPSLLKFYSEPFVVRESCLLAFKHSTTQKPIDWK
ncbi:MAG: DUF4249 domain-containing protein [Cyclobacteriaceae bacterium]